MELQKLMAEIIDVVKEHGNQDNPKVSLRIGEDHEYYELTDVWPITDDDGNLTEVEIVGQLNSEVQNKLNISIPVYYTPNEAGKNVFDPESLKMMFEQKLSELQKMEFFEISNDGFAGAGKDGKFYTAKDWGAR